MPKIAQYLGHRDDRITQRVYARFSPLFLRDAADALELDVYEVHGGSGEPGFHLAGSGKTPT
jgi:integrase